MGAAEPVNADELSGTLVNGPQANSNLTAYFVDSDGTNHVFYNYMGYVHELWWHEGGVGENHENLTAFSGAPLAASDPSAYYDADARRIMSFMQRPMDTSTSLRGSSARWRGGIRSTLRATLVAQEALAGDWGPLPFRRRGRRNPRPADRFGRL